MAGRKVTDFSSLLRSKIEEFDDFEDGDWKHKLYDRISKDEQVQAHPDYKDMVKGKYYCTVRPKKYFVGKNNLGR